MSVQVDFLPLCDQKLTAIKHKQPKLFQKIKKQLLLFSQNPKHPSLRLHKLKGELRDTWSISITKELRMIFYFRLKNHQKSAVFIDIGTHDQVYT